VSFVTPSRRSTLRDRLRPLVADAVDVAGDVAIGGGHRVLDGEGLHLRQFHVDASAVIPLAHQCPMSGRAATL
jgi:hypothetical protein